MNDYYYDQLLQRAESFIEAVGSSVTKFCARCGLSASHYYKWRSHLTTISAEKAAAIDDYLSQFGY